MSRLVADLMYQSRSLVTHASSCPWSPFLISTAPQVMVVSSEGVLYCYQIDLENGGEGILQKNHNLLEGLDSYDSYSPDTSPSRQRQNGHTEENGEYAEP